MKFVVAHTSFYDNNLTQEIVEAESEGEARWMHSQLQEPCWYGCKEETMDMDGETFQTWCLQIDMLISVIEIPAIVSFRRPPYLVPHNP